jgi:hypothetical protein
MGEKDLKINLDFVEENKESLLKEHKNKFILVFAKKLMGSYDSYERAAEEGVRLYGLDGSFLVYHLVEKEPLNFIMGVAPR